MRIFYLVWFFFCIGWGYLSATFPLEQTSSLLEEASWFPVVFFSSLVMIWIELKTLPAQKLASAPSLQLKPWNRPTGMAIFIGLTFAFSGFWGVLLWWVYGLSSPHVALRFFCMGTGLVGACWAAYLAFPNQFSAPDDARRQPSQFDSANKLGYGDYRPRPDFHLVPSISSPMSNA